jgi:FAD binding domain
MRLWDRELPEAGLSVAVLEKSGLFGGTSAVSAGTVWVPGNPYMSEVGRVDDPALALRYLEQATAGKTPPPARTRTSAAARTSTTSTAATSTTRTPARTWRRSPRGRSTPCG